MGASDELLRGRSTFMVEMTELGEILRTSSSRSLLILDEIGRGTSTHDGTAIAEAALEYIVRKTNALTVFVTHFPLIGQLARVRSLSDRLCLIDLSPDLSLCRHSVPSPLFTWRAWKPSETMDSLTSSSYTESP